MSLEKKEDLAFSSEKITFIGPAVSIEGEIRGQEDIIIEGQVKGTLHFPAANVRITEQGRVEANIRVKSVSIRGEVVGDIEASARVTIERTGRMRGNISASVISIEEGAQFKGAIRIVDKPM